MSTKIAHVEARHGDVLKVTLRCLLPTRSDPLGSCGWPWPKGNMRSNSYINPLPWFNHVATNIHNNADKKCKECGIVCNSNESRAHQHMHYTSHACQVPECGIAITHTPFYRDHWDLHHKSQYPLKRLNADKTKRPLAIKIEKTFDLPLVLPRMAEEARELENYEKSAYTDWRSSPGPRDAMDDLRIKTSHSKNSDGNVEDTVGSEEGNRDEGERNPFFDGEVPTPPEEEIELVTLWDARLKAFLCDGLPMSSHDVRYFLHAGLRSTARLHAGLFLNPWLRQTLDTCTTHGVSEETLVTFIIYLRTGFFAPHSDSLSDVYTAWLAHTTFPPLTQQELTNVPASEASTQVIPATSRDYRRLNDESTLQIMAAEYKMSIEELLEYLVASQGKRSTILEVFTLARIVSVHGYHALTFDFQRKMALERKRVVLMSNRLLGHLSGVPRFSFSYRDFIGVYQAVREELGAGTVDQTLRSTFTTMESDQKKVAKQVLKRMGRCLSVSVKTDTNPNNTCVVHSQ